MATHPKLEAQKRTTLGKQVKRLRREGLLPANIYGKNLNSTAVQVKLTDFQSVYKEVGETGLVDVMLDGERRPVLFKNVQLNYRLHTPLHVDLYQVNLKEKVKSMVPIIIIGEPKAVTEKLGVLLTTLNEVEVEALPEELPDNIEVNVEPLAQLDEQITVADLKVPAGVNVLNDPTQIVARIGEMMKEEEPAPAEGEEVAMPEVITEKKAEEGEETPEAEKSEDK